MLYSLIKYLEKFFDIPGSGMFQYISFRAAAAIILALLIGMVFGNKLIATLRRKQIGEEIRNLGLDGQMEKKGTPTMGGIIILISILVPILLIGDLRNVYVRLMIISTVWLGTLGFADDYIKVFRKHKDGLKGKFKIIGQVGLGIIIGTAMCLNQNIVVVEKSKATHEQQVSMSQDGEGAREAVAVAAKAIGEKTTKTTIPFVKNNEFDNQWLVPSHSS